MQFVERLYETLTDARAHNSHSLFNELKEVPTLAELFDICKNNECLNYGLMLIVFELVIRYKFSLDTCFVVILRGRICSALVDELLSCYNKPSTQTSIVQYLPASYLLESFFDWTTICCKLSYSEGYFTIRCPRVKSSDVGVQFFTFEGLEISFNKLIDINTSDNEYNNKITTCSRLALAQLYVSNNSFDLAYDVVKPLLSSNHLRLDREYGIFYCYVVLLVLMLNHKVDKLKQFKELVLERRVRFNISSYKNQHKTACLKVHDIVVKQLITITSHYLTNYTPTAPLPSVVLMQILPPFIKSHDEKLTVDKRRIGNTFMSTMSDLQALEKLIECANVYSHISVEKLAKVASSTVEATKEILQKTKLLKYNEVNDTVSLAQNTNEPVVDNYITSFFKEARSLMIDLSLDSTTNK